MPNEPDHTTRTAGGRALALSLLLTAVFDIGLALVAFHIARRLGADDRLAYLASGVGPATMMVITWVRARTLSGASVVILLFLLLSSAATFIGGSDPRLLVAKDSAVTAGFGAACLLSLVFPRPLMFYFGAKFATDGTAEGARHWSGLWRHHEFRRSQYLITAVWGIGFLVEGALRVLAAYTMSFAAANAVAAILPWVFLAGLVGFSIVVGRRARAAGLARVAAQPSSVVVR
ncbi:VC0807 family protein [Actinoplanes sp. NPDC049548]|uniref:VC0807 family protein n=1 Tax=Actinoplanes sp. NPDC049548 TaxID=3155152 RepID=UPI003435B2C5